MNLDEEESRERTAQWREYRSGASYRGQLHGNAKSGHGVFHWPNGTSYEGEYADNKRHGKGVEKWHDQSVYTGDFVEDLRQGFGEHVWQNGEQFTGEFFRDQKHGKGVYTWPDGTVFDGFFENDKKNGYGVFTFPSGNVFKGIYKDGERDGPGVLTYPDGRQDAGTWFGENLVKLCSIMENAFLFEHFADYNVNAGKNLSAKVRQSNSAYGRLRTPPAVPGQYLNFTDQEIEKFLEQCPEDFPLKDILEGYRSDDLGELGPLEIASEELLNAASVGDVIKVKGLLDEGKVHVDVADKTGYTALLAAAVNCHRDVINCLLDNGADVNKQNNEGLSVLAACHVLFYTKHTWKDNIAETIPKENLFNSIWEDKNKTTYFHRNYRRNGTSSTTSSKSSTPKKLSRDDSGNKSYDILDLANEDKSKNGLENGVEDDDVCGSEKDKYSNDTNSDKSNKSYDAKTASKSKTNILKIDSSTNTCDEDIVENQSSEQRTKLLDMFNNNNNIAKSLSSSGNGSADEKEGSKEYSLLTECSMMNFASVTRVTEQSDDSETESSLQHNKQKLLVIQRRPHLEATVRLLLKRGANPNISSLPMPVIFFAVKAADTDAVEILLNKGADTSVKLSPEQHGLAPLHIAVALPCQDAIPITELLLRSGADPNIRDSAWGDPVDGRTPLHVACCKEDGDEDANRIIELLVEHGANPDLTSRGHSPLSLSICAGNDMAVETLLRHQANPSLLLTHGVGSALCATTTFMAERRRASEKRLKLINKLVRAGANVLAPITVTTKFPSGTVVDYAYHVHNQDRRIAHTPYHALTLSEREVYNARNRLLSHFGDLLRTQVLKKEQDMIERQIAARDLQEGPPASAGSSIDSPDIQRNILSGGPAVSADSGVHTMPSASRVTFNLEGLDPKDRDSLRKSVTPAEEVVPEVSRSPGDIPLTPYEVFGSPPGSPAGRGESCGLRVAVMTTLDHMQVSDMATAVLQQRKQAMRYRYRYCYDCGRSIGVRLAACTRCREVFYCSKTCKLKAWNSRHKDECVKVTGTSRPGGASRSESPTPTTDPDVPKSTSRSGTRVSPRGTSPRRNKDKQVKMTGAKSPRGKTSPSIRKTRSSSN